MGQQVHLTGVQVDFGDCAIVGEIPEIQKMEIHQAPDFRAQLFSPGLNRIVVNPQHLCLQPGFDAEFRIGYGSQTLLEKSRIGSKNPFCPLARRCQLSQESLKIFARKNLNF